MTNKLHLTVKHDMKNQYFYFGKGNKRVQLCGDSRKDGFWLFQASDKIEEITGREGFSNNFKRDLKDILKYMADNEMPIFTLYELPEIIYCETND